MKRSDLLALSFYEASPFTGSEGNMRYRIEKIEENGKKRLKVTTWPEPYSYDYTDDAKKTEHLEDFSEEGMTSVVTWLMEQKKTY